MATIAEEAQAERRKRAEELINSTVNSLSSMQRTAVIEYLSGKTRTDAATIAGYKNPEKQCSRIFNTPNVRDAIDNFFHAQEMSAREVVARLSQQAKAEYGRYLRWDSRVNEVVCDIEAMLADGLGHLIKKVGYDRTGTESAVQVVEFYDAHQALVDVGRYHGLFKDRTDLTSGGEKLEVLVKYADRDDNTT